VLEPSGLKTVSWVLTKAQIEIPALSALLDKVMEAGGFWERIFSGILLVHLPPAEQEIIVGQFNSSFSQPNGTAPDR
jgi:hypothetical protein